MGVRRGNWWGGGGRDWRGGSGVVWEGLEGNDEGVWCSGAGDLAGLGLGLRWLGLGGWCVVFGGVLFCWAGTAGQWFG